ncbi:major surface-labeled trophozoite antigen 417 [Drosophila nasuta]|uniref:major surface-labeled trophozoite antigen 417 n=1 Tax=Drosophila nasuta TaxID=42062 RepID=UPI00295E7E34|nr:major surface-labeled trophozoite antigen 417 [Drosophila nasuta]
MQFNKVGIFMAAIIAINLQGSLANSINCTTTGSEALTTCADDITSCFIQKAQNGTVTRGCLPKDTTCTAPDCLTCEGNNCNSNVNLMCRQCNGSDTACSTSNVTTSAVICAANQLCTAAVNTDETVSRGCGEQCAADNATCFSCTTDNCNLAIFPTDRRQCYQCTGEACNTVTDAMLEPCSLYKTEGQKCYTIGTNANTMIRGCTSDANAKCTTTTEDASCLLCDNENGCNNRTYESVLNKCIKCSNDDTCLNAQNAADAQNCASSNYTLTAASCYTQLFDNGTVARGCVNELTETCDTENDCKECSTDACNTEEGTFTCYVCRSDNDPGCRTMTNIPPSPCINTSLTSTDSKQCLSGEWDGIVIRGCLIDASEVMKFQCVYDDDRCIACKGANCNNNTEKYNSAATLQHLGLGMLTIFFLVRNVVL